MYFLLCFWKCPWNLIEPEVFQVGDKFNMIDPYDGSIVGNGQIQPLSMIHGLPLGPEDANVNAINVTSNIPLSYEYNIDGCDCLKET